MTATTIPTSDELQAALLRGETLAGTESDGATWKVWRSDWGGSYPPMAQLEVWLNGRGIGSGVDVEDAHFHMMINLWALRGELRKHIGDPPSGRWHLESMFDSPKEAI